MEPFLRRQWQRPSSRSLVPEKRGGLFQAELVFGAGMSVPYLSDLERGHSNPSLAMVVDLARALATHLSVMLAGLIIERGRRAAAAQAYQGLMGQGASPSSMCGT
ncbi:XRE family transcriptional regulator (plasmid) [Azospirillum argentinense]|uniref:XRE family transcriptional regulator n=1 Tax=Azospirillum brasilense TaxID=192 RepID=A0A4D8Q627_AZOBR|nr:XRE family transcriptional regulator [Azospirillum argentinense]